MPTRDEFLTVDDLVKHARMSRRTIMKWLHHPLTPLPHRKIGRVVYILADEYRTWTEQFKVEPNVVDVRAMLEDAHARHGGARR